MENAMNSCPPVHLKLKELWLTRKEYQEFPLETFRDHMAQQRRSFTKIPGWQTNRNKQAAAEYARELQRMKRAWDENMDGDAI
jgi:hypothetical protein